MMVDAEVSQDASCIPSHKAHTAEAVQLCFFEKHPNSCLKIFFHVKKNECANWEKHICELSCDVADIGVM